MTEELKDIIVIKLGGSIFDDKDTSLKDIVELQKHGRHVVIVHGGAAKVTGWLKKMDIPTTIIHGERVTDAATLEVVTAVLCGLVNKEIVATIIEGGGKAVGICGADGALIQAKQRSAEMGLMGDAVKVNPEPLLALLKAGFIPVVAPVSLHSFERPDDVPLLININGDPAAGEIAAALCAEKLVFLTDVPGIRDGEGKHIDKIKAAAARRLVESGVAFGGMVPKVRACLRALSGGACACIIDGKQPHNLLKEIDGEAAGTTIEND